MYHNYGLISDVMTRLAVRDKNATDLELKLLAKFAIRVDRALQSTLVEEDEDYAQSAAEYERFDKEQRDRYNHTPGEALDGSETEAGDGVEDLYFITGPEESAGTGDEEARDGGGGYPRGDGRDVAGSGGAQGDRDDARAQEAGPEAADSPWGVNGHNREGNHGNAGNPVGEDQ